MESNKDELANQPTQPDTCKDGTANNDSNESNKDTKSAQQPTKRTEKIFPLITKKHYHDAKRTLIRVEKYNNHRIYLIYCQGKAGWCEAAERSALFFYYEVVRRVGSKHRLFADPTTSNPYSIGYLRFRSPDAAVELAKRAGIYQSHGIDNHSLLYIELKKPYDDDEIQEFLEKDRQRRLLENTISPAANLAPEFYQLIVNTGRRLYAICNNNLIRSARNSSGENITRLLHDSVVLYHHIVGAKPFQAKHVMNSWLDITTNMRDVTLELQVICDLRLVSFPENIVDIVESTKQLRNLAYREYKKAQKQYKIASTNGAADTAAGHPTKDVGSTATVTSNEPIKDTKITDSDTLDEPTKSNRESK